MVQPLVPQVEEEDPVGGGGGGGEETVPAPVTVRPLKTKFAVEQLAEEEQAGESSQLIEPDQILQTGTKPV
jgi:hypothetical protein